MQKEGTIAQNDIPIEGNKTIKKYFPSHLKNYRLTPVSGSPTVFGSSSQTVLFEIPNGVINFSKMSLNFKRGSIPAAGANIHRCVISSHIPYIEKIELKTSTGVLLCDINGVDVLSRLSMALLNKFTENTQNNAALYPSFTNVDSSNDGENFPKMDPFLDNLNQITPGNLGVWNPDKTSLNSSTLIRYGNYDWGLTNASNIIIPEKYISISMQDLIPDSIFGCDKLIYNARNMYLRIQFAPKQKLVYQLNKDLSTYSVYNGADIGFENLNLNMYVEADPTITAMIQQEFNQQQVLCIPRVESHNISISNSAGDKSVIVKVLNTGDSRLYKFYSGLVSASQCTLGSDNKVLNTINNTSNYNNNKYSNIDLYLNTLQLLSLNVEQNQDLEHMVQFFTNHSFSDLPSFKSISPFAHVFDSDEIKNKLYDCSTMRGLQFDQPNGEHSIQIRWKITSPGTNLQNPVGQTNLIAYVFPVSFQKIYVLGGDWQLTPFI